jgi:hypothetical protein
VIFKASGSAFSCRRNWFPFLGNSILDRRNLLLQLSRLFSNRISQNSSVRRRTFSRLHPCFVDASSHPPKPDMPERKHFDRKDPFPYTAPALLMIGRKCNHQPFFESGRRFLLFHEHTLKEVFKSRNPFPLQNKEEK